MHLVKDMSCQEEWNVFHSTFCAGTKINNFADMCKMLLGIVADSPVSRYGKMLRPKLSRGLPVKFASLSFVFDGSCMSRRTRAPQAGDWGMSCRASEY